MKKADPLLSIFRVAGMITILIHCISCLTGPKDFTYYYKNEYTGLDTLINTHGYYVTQRACDSTFFAVFMFYNNGLYTVATATDWESLAECFEKGGNSNHCQYPLWGTYRIEGNRIKTQCVREEGIGTCVIFRDYEISPEKSLLNLNEYIHPENTNIGNMTNYPSFKENPCLQPARFYPLQSKRDSLECPLLKRNYFKAR